MSERFEEPCLIDLLQDPLTEIVMARDGVSRDAMMSLLTWAAAHQAAPSRREGQVRHDGHFIRESRS